MFVEIFIWNPAFSSHLNFSCACLLKLQRKQACLAEPIAKVGRIYQAESLTLVLKEFHSPLQQRRHHSTNDDEPEFRSAR
jgi:hypothetical protein